MWTNAYGTDDQTLAKKGVGIVRDSRVRHYWDAKAEIALDFGKVVKVPRDSPLAYDVYFVYGSGIEWKDDAPIPSAYMHQILDGDQFFEPKKFVELIKKEISKLPLRAR